MMKDVWIWYLKTKIKKSLGKSYRWGSTENIMKANSRESTRGDSLRYLQLCRKGSKWAVWGKKNQQLAKQRSGSISWWREQAGQQRCAHVGWAGMGLGSLPRVSLVWLCSDRGDVGVAFLASSSHHVPREQLCLSPLLRQSCEQMTISGWVLLPWVGATALWWLTNVPK